MDERMFLPNRAAAQSALILGSVFTAASLSCAVPWLIGVALRVPVLSEESAASALFGALTGLPSLLLFLYGLGKRREPPLRVDSERFTVDRQVIAWADVADVLLAEDGLRIRVEFTTTRAALYVDRYAFRTGDEDLFKVLQDAHRYYWDRPLEPRAEPSVEDDVVAVADEIRTPRWRLVLNSLVPIAFCLWLVVSTPWLWFLSLTSEHVGGATAWGLMLGVSVILIPISALGAFGVYHQVREIRRSW